MKTLDQKLEYTKDLIHCWYEAWDGKVYISWSGGLDSTVLKHIAQSLYPDIPAVFINTGLEYPEIVSFVKQDKNAIILRPKKSFKWVIENKGYPVISKEQAQYISNYRNFTSKKILDIRWNGNKYGRGKISEKWKFLVNAPFKISDKCCDILKKEPAKRYEKESGRRVMLGNLAIESSKRIQQSNTHKCNDYESKYRQISRPLTWWTPEYIWQYIKENKIKYSTIYDMGYERTGCMFCGFGVDRETKERGFNRFILMQKTHPKQYRFCMEKLGLKEVLQYIGVPWENRQYEIWPDAND